MYKVLEVDMARFGKDESIILVRQDQRVLEVQKWRNLDLVGIVAHVQAMIKKWEPNVILVDPAGVGAGIVDYLRHLGFEVIERFRRENYAL